MRRRIWTIGTALVAAPLLGATLLGASTAGAAVLPEVPAPGGRLQPVEYHLPDAAGWSFYRLGPAGTRWSVTFSLAAAATCAGGGPVVRIGVLARGPAAPGAVLGPVLTARLYGADSTRTVVLRELTGEQLLSCLRTVDPTLPAGTDFTASGEQRTYFASGVAAADGSLDVVSGSASGYFVSRVPAGSQSWDPPAPVDGYGGGPAVTRLSNGGLRTVIAAEGFALYTFDVSPDRRFSGWRRAGGTAISDPAAAQLPDGGTSAWFVGGNGRLYQGVWTAGGTLTRFIPLGTPEDYLAYTPGVTATGGGRYTVAVRADGGRVYTRSYVPGAGWGAYTRVPGITAAGFGLAAVSPAPGEVQLFWISPTFHVLTRRLVNGKWLAISDLGGDYNRVTASARDGRIELFADGNPENQGIHWRTYAGGWSAWRAVQ